MTLKIQHQSLVRLSERILYVDHPQRLAMGFHLPTRMTIIQLTNGDLALISVVPLSEELRIKLADLGAVKYLIAPNLLHHLYLKAAKRAFPGARVLAPKALRTKRADLHIDFDLEDSLPPDLSYELTTIHIEGAPGIDEFVFFHPASKTLIVTDLVFNVRGPEGFVSHLMLFMVGCYKRLGQSRVWRFATKDIDAFDQSLLRVLELDFDQLVMAHGDVIQEDANALLRLALPKNIPRRRLRA